MGVIRYHRGGIGALPADAAVESSVTEGRFTTRVQHALLRAVRIGACGSVLAWSLMAVPMQGWLIVVPLALSVLWVPDRLDGEALATVYIVLLVAIPTRFVLEPMGAVGTPALLVGIGAWWWLLADGLMSRAKRASITTGEIAVLLFMGTMVVAYVSGLMRPMVAIERSATDRALIAVMSNCGIALLISRLFSSDGIERLLRRVVVVGSILALVAVVQFQTSYDPVAAMDVPLLHERSVAGEIEQRSSFDRAEATASHPIELSVVLAMLFPLSLHFAYNWDSTNGKSRSLKSRLIRILPLMMVAVTIPFTVSRSGVLAVGVAYATLSVSWSWRRRFNAAIATILFTAVMRAAVPGLLGTIKSLFLGARDDPSVKGRTMDVELVRSYFVERPLTGRGLGTLIPELYFFLDNQVFGTLVETGLLGLTALAFMLATAGAGAWIGGGAFDEPRLESLSRAVAASVAAASVSLVTFDGLSFRMFTGLLFVLVGSAAVLRRQSVTSHGAASVKAFEPTRAGNV